jgi:hypothetical protein
MAPLQPLAGYSDECLSFPSYMEFLSKPDWAKEVYETPISTGGEKLSVEAHITIQ